MVKMRLYTELSLYHKPNTDRPKCGMHLGLGSSSSAVQSFRKVSVRNCLAPLSCPFSFTQQHTHHRFRLYRPTVGSAAAALALATLVASVARWQPSRGVQTVLARALYVLSNLPLPAYVCIRMYVVTCAAVTPWDCFSRVLLPVPITASSRARRRPRD